jgi:hypothetical protein
MQVMSPESCFLFIPAKSKSNGLILRHNGTLDKVCLWRLKKKERPIPGKRIGLGREIV